ncbi:MAG TPA: hypothetical protein PK264_01795 [Hyphomicrobiaceae bacterium]|nr:hypothetical protein [Hyphomicrobiaceae bacterium]
MSSRPVRTHWFTWRHLRCKVVEKPCDLGDHDTLLELHVIAARDTPVPITTTGFLAHFLSTAALTGAGGPTTFFTTWMDREARSRDYQLAEFLWRQGDLFDRLVPDEGRDA